MSKLNEALGYIEDKYLIEADENRCARRKPKLKFVPLIAACALLLAVGVAAVGIRYFAPGVGIVDGGVKVYAAKESVMLGDIVVDTVMLTESDEESSLTVWLWRENEVEIDPGQAKQGIPPEELEDLTAEINGNVYDNPSWGGATIGYTTYVFKNVEVGDDVILRSKGEEVSVPLVDARTSKRSGTMKYGKKQIELIQVSDDDNLWAAEIKDDFALGFAKEGVGVSATIYLAAKTDEEVGQLSGDMTLIGSGKVSSDVVKASLETHGRSIDELAVKTITYNFRFRDIIDSMPDIKVKIPESGETMPCDLVLYEGNGIIVHLKSVTNGEKALLYECEVENKSGEKFIGAIADAKGYVRRDYEYDANGEHIAAKDQLTSIYNRNGEVCMYDFTTGEDIVLEPGSEIIVKLVDVRIQYGSSDLEFSPNLGAVKLK